ncbi:hypothetical protein A1O3_09297 [Capronia epimyces CBS 606.96]|uniref:3-oxoacyl-[acyl-carrier protein] reductase n=1 Tax=Capronia epimyces CBS 606.96 TaxID=1182542 RepID=W9XMC7_9EURO|nr:uncharacterized protein A1O3_09297 [Capronia epimyces CBS 606.96]EXJ78136.1 hypothetical protein A1O3_09297 [Capronia epimyces CBS 606.96]
MDGISPPLDLSTAFDASSVRGAGVFITGGASGLGAALVRAFGKAGAYVTFGDVQVDAGQLLEREMTSQGLRARFVHCDVTSFPSQSAAFRAALDFHPAHQLNIVVPNAGVATGHEQLLSVFRPERFPPASLDTDALPPPCPDLASLQVNLIGVIYSVSLAMHYFRLPEMQTQTQTQMQMPIPTQAPSRTSTNKAITFVSSMAGYTALPGGTLYMTAKFGVRGLFHSMRKYVGAEGVRVNLLAPGYMETAMTANVLTALQGSGVQLAKLSDAVDAVLRLSIDPSVNGRAICVGASGNRDLCDDPEGIGASLEADSVNYDHRLFRLE